MKLMPQSYKKGLAYTLYYLRRMYHYFRPHKKSIVISIIFMSIYSLTSSAMALLVKPMLDRIFIQKDQTSLMLIPLMVVVIFIIRGLSFYIQNYQIHYCTLKGLEDIRNDLYNKLIRFPISFFEHNQVGMLLARIVNDVEQINRSAPQVIKIFRYFLTILLLICVAFYRDSYLATWVILILPLVLFPLIYLSKKLRKFGRKRQREIGEISSYIQEKFSAIQVIKSFATEDKETNNFVNQNAKLCNAAIKRRFYHAMSTPSIELILGFGVGIVVFYGGTQVIAGNSTPGNFFSFLTALSLLFKPLQKLNNSNMKIQQSLVGAERVFNILDSRDIHEEQGGSLPLQEAFSGLYFENVTFYYPNFSRPALQNINLDINPAEKLAIVGPSGAGKSTLVNLIPRFYSPQKGNITLNAKDLSQYNLVDLRRYVGIITQDGMLFNTSIRENLTYGMQDVSREKLDEVCSVAQIKDFIDSLQDGYETIIGEQGKILSGGQKQRLIIARTLLKDPELLILDEATSAMDPSSEQNVQKALSNLMQSKTSIVIAHRLSTILTSDRIVVMDNGKILDIGTHAQLYERCDLYCKLYNLEFQD